MSKIICDVCGTSYPETATQCPICGCVRSGEPITVAGDTNDAEVYSETTYTRVKGGRFSKNNVKKRNAGKPVYNAEPVEKKSEKPRKSKKGEIGLVITIIVLLLAISAVVVYIALSYFGIDDFWKNFDKGDNTIQNAQTTTNSDDQTILDIPCESLKVSDSVVEFDKVGAVRLLNVKALPEDHTDTITYSSENDDIATVDVNGKVVAVGPGQTTITITCGDQISKCDVVCSFAPETTEATVPEITYSTDSFKLNREDFTLPTSEKTWTLYNGEIPVDLIEWKTADEKVATFANGVVTAVGPGVTTVSAVFQGVTLECIVRVY